jgi:hypothetical protein
MENRDSGGINRAAMLTDLNRKSEMTVHDENDDYCLCYKCRYEREVKRGNVIEASVWDNLKKWFNSEDEFLAKLAKHLWY